MRRLTIFTIAMVSSLIQHEGWPVAVALGLTSCSLALTSRRWLSLVWVLGGFITGLALSSLESDRYSPSRPVAERTVQLGTTRVQSPFLSSSNDRIKGVVQSSNGKWQLSVDMSIPWPRTGDYVYYVGSSFTPGGPTNPFEPDFASLQTGRGLRGYSSAQAAVLRPGSAEGLSWAQTAFRWFEPLRQRVRNNTQHLSASARAMLSALVLGDSGGLTDFDRSLYSDTGTSHLFAVSGLHLSTAASLALLLIGPIIGLVPDRLGSGVRKRLLSLVSWIAGFGFLCLTAAPVSCVRAFLMLSGQTLARSLNFSYDIWTWLSASVLLILAARPSALGELSFQLSVICVAGISATSQATTQAVQRLKGKDLRQPLMAVARSTVSSAVTSSSSSIATLTPVWRVFGTIPSGPVPANLIAVPVISYLIFPLAIVMSLLGDLWGIPGELFNHLVFILNSFLEHIIIFLPSFTISFPGVFWALILSILTFVALFHTHGRLRVAMAALMVSIAMLVVPQPRSTGQAGEAVFLNTGEGDTTVIHTPCGTKIMVDGGPPGSGRFSLLPYLKQTTGSRVDVLFITHAHDDHYAGLLEVADRMTFCTIYVSGLGNSNSVANKLSRRSTGCQSRHPIVRSLREGDRVDVCNGELVVWWPPEQYQSQGENDLSLVITVRLGDMVIVLPGDLEARHDDSRLQTLVMGISRYIQGQPNSRVLLKAPHHGHASPAFAEFTHTLGPDTVFIPSDGGKYLWLTPLLAVPPPHPLAHVSGLDKALSVPFEP